MSEFQCNQSWPDAAVDAVVDNGDWQVHVDPAVAFDAETVNHEAAQRPLPTGQYRTISGGRFLVEEGFFDLVMRRVREIYPHCRSGHTYSVPELIGHDLWLRLSDADQRIATEILKHAEAVDPEFLFGGAEDDGVDVRFAITPRCDPDDPLCQVVVDDENASFNQPLIKGAPTEIVLLRGAFLLNEKHYDDLLEKFTEILDFLLPGRQYTAQELCGHDYWEGLSSVGRRLTIAFFKHTCDLCPEQLQDVSCIKSGLTRFQIR